MVNYEKAKVYKIWSTAGDKIYIGSTTKDFLSQRMDTHRSGYKQWKKGNNTLTRSFNLFDEYGIENCFIELLEAKVCNSKDELKQLEGKYIRSMACVNKYIPDRSKIEYREDNKDKIKEQKKEYYDDNKDTIKEHLKQYYDDNKETIKLRVNQYRNDNKEIIREKKNKPFDCECGGKYTHTNKTIHLKSIKHCQYISSLQ